MMLLQIQLFVVFLLSFTKSAPDVIIFSATGLVVLYNRAKIYYAGHVFFFSSFFFSKVSAIWSVCYEEITRYGKHEKDG